MTLRQIIRIDEERCDGCGECVPSCAEGAIAVVGGKARLVSQRLCDGLGSCLGHCPRGAITIEWIEAVPFDRAAVGQHLATRFTPPAPFVACPGSREVSLESVELGPAGDDAQRPSKLRQWPVQLHLVSPAAPAFRGADVLLAADCVAYAVGDFHRDHLAGKALAIACPKLDSHQEVYLEKLVALIDGAGIASLTVMVMEVPCCGGLLRLAQAASARAVRRVPVRSVVVGIRGDISGGGGEPHADGRGEPPRLPAR